VAKTSKKFIVVGMNQEDFISIDELKRFFKDKVTGIWKMKWLHFAK
jgi:hypothetical protein